MSKLNHTPGPWKDKNIEFYSQDIMGICATFNDDKTESKANALLIACAPEMLEYLINELHGEYSDYLDLDKVDSRLIEVIEKATGLTINEVLNAE